MKQATTVASRSVRMPLENACQGLPDGPCPKRRQDNSVVFTIYDLFLCPSCVLAREQAAGGTNGNTSVATAATANEVPAKAVRNRSRKADSAASKASAGTPRSGHLSANERVMSASGSRLVKLGDGGMAQANGQPKESTAAAAAAAARTNDAQLVEIEDLRHQVDQLTSTVTKQSEEIARLTSRLNFVLSFLDIHHEDVELSSLGESAAGTDHDGSSAANAQSTAPQSRITKSFAEVVQQSVRSISKEVNNASCQDFVTAVYIEQHDKARRANSFVVSGLPGTEQAADDEQLIKALCREEFGQDVNVLSCKRIGRQQPGKPRKLLVFLQSPDQASTIIQDAKTLRKSSSVAVRANVYINPNLTKAEAKAQYEMRQRRRQTGSANRPIALLQGPTSAVADGSDGSDALRVNEGLTVPGMTGDQQAGEMGRLPGTGKQSR